MSGQRVTDEQIAEWREAGRYDPEDTVTEIVNALEAERARAEKAAAKLAAIRETADLTVVTTDLSDMQRGYRIGWNSMRERVLKIMEGA